MPKLRVTIIDEVRNRRLKVDLPDDAALEKLLPALAKKLGLPPAAYRLTHETTGRALGGDQTLTSFGVGDGDALRLAVEKAVPFWQKVPPWGWIGIVGVVLLAGAVLVFWDDIWPELEQTPTAIAKVETPAVTEAPTLPAPAPTATPAPPMPTPLSLTDTLTTVPPTDTPTPEPPTPTHTCTPKPMLTSTPTFTPTPEVQFIAVYSDNFETDTGWESYDGKITNEGYVVGPWAHWVTAWNTTTVCEVSGDFAIEGEFHISWVDEGDKAVALTAGIPMPGEWWTDVRYDFFIVWDAINLHYCDGTEERVEDDLLDRFPTPSLNDIDGTYVIRVERVGQMLVVYLNGERLGKTKDVLFSGDDVPLSFALNVGPGNTAILKRLAVFAVQGQEDNVSCHSR